jgi:hypothetical protein
MGLVGQLNAWTTVGNIVGQVAGAYAGAGIQWGFFNTEGSVIAPVTTDTLTLGVLFGWEIWMSFILTLGILLGMSDRIFGEGRDVDGSGRRKKTDVGYAPETQGTSQDVPAGLQKEIYSHMAARTAVTGSVLYFGSALLGYLFNGAPVVNYWFWTSHTLAPAVVAPPVGTMTGGIQFCLYAFGSLTGSIGAAFVMMGLLIWCRKVVFSYVDEDKCDKEEKGLWYWARL